MPLSRKFVTKEASLSAPDPAAGAAGDDNSGEEPQANADPAAQAPAPLAAVAESAPPPPAPAAPPTPPREARGGRGGGKPRA
jgi:hypothetical protein